MSDHFVTCPVCKFTMRIPKKKTGTVCCPNKHITQVRKGKVDPPGNFRPLKPGPVHTGPATLGLHNEKTGEIKVIGKTDDVVIEPSDPYDPMDRAKDQRMEDNELADLRAEQDERSMLGYED